MRSGSPHESRASRRTHRSHHRRHSVSASPSSSNASGSSVSILSQGNDSSDMTSQHLYQLLHLPAYQYEGKDRDDHIKAFNRYVPKPFLNSDDPQAWTTFVGDLYLALDQSKPDRRDWPTLLQSAVAADVRTNLQLPLKCTSFTAWMKTMHRTLRNTPADVQRWTSKMSHTVPGNRPLTCT